MDNLSRYGATARQRNEATLYPELHLARVVSQHQMLYTVVTDADEFLAETSGKFRYAAAAPEDYPAVGDFVMVDRADGSAGNGAIHAVLTRKSAFVRKAAGTARESQIVASNIDVTFVCMALNENYNVSRLERYLAVAWDSGAVPVVVLTKADLCADLPAALRAVQAAAPLADVAVTSRFDRAACEKLLSYVGPGVTACLIGSSGVGKSTLINLLADGAAVLETGAIRQDGKGRHTTTYRCLVPLASGGVFIDTPGMRELGAESADLSRAFPDVETLAENCRFADCTHTGEPGCAVLAAVESGALDARRLESYKKLRRETGYEGLTARGLESRKQNAMFAAVGGMKKMRKYVRETDKRKGGSDDSI